ncbi:hypothetical protein [Mycobacterium sp. RTGN5]|uniref:hypothetical protein n=1 Tax=Mycobacterium sp. RTGN5 TaxID=3016522 RepID=UPI0029C8730A|nr:hypothetical protein [Mycobacterium sp. RTGN5]
MAEDGSAPFIGMPADGSAKKSRATPWISALVPLTLVVLLLAAGAFAISQAVRPWPGRAAAPPTQPYLDFGMSFADRLMMMSPQTVDVDSRRIVEVSTEHFHDSYLQWRGDFLKSVLQDGTLVEGPLIVAGSATAAALKSIDVSNGKAQVLVAAKGTVTDHVGEMTPQHWHLLLTVERTDGTLKTSQVEVVR